ncbi:MAG: recQ, partial [Proteobacteria bacterium]|nr:recQ [Pseudomonadota bacterium]
ETGRAGRDGQPADAWMVYGLQDVITLRSMVEASSADDMHKRVERHKLDAMLGYCELTGCRRQTLLSYFGDHLEKPCGNCDNCLEPAQTWDATEPARMALSCVYRTGQRFGAHHVIDVLLGKTHERVRSLGHDRLSTHGIGQALTERQWLSVFRQLVTQGFLSVDWESHGALRLSERCRAILRGEQSLCLRRDVDAMTHPPKQAKSGSQRFSRLEDERLWHALRQLRRQLANDQDVPPYVIFLDTVLSEMVSSRPQTLEELGTLAGIGERKLDRYGEQFLEVIQAYAAPSATGVADTTSTVEETLNLYHLGMSVEQIAVRRGLKLTTIYGHLAEAIASGQAELLEVTGLEGDEVERIRLLWMSLAPKDRARLKPLHEALAGAYDFGILRCLLAAWTRASNPDSSTQ